MKTKEKFSNAGGTERTKETERENTPQQMRKGGKMLGSESGKKKVKVKRRMKGQRRKTKVTQMSGNSGYLKCLLGREAERERLMNRARPVSEG